MFQSSFVTKSISDELEEDLQASSPILRKEQTLMPQFSFAASDYPGYVRRVKQT